MTPKAKMVVLSLGLAALLSGCGHSSVTAKDATHGAANANMESKPGSQAANPVHTIVMPHDEPALPPGPGHDEFETACVVCHSPRYITSQPRFSRATWLSEVDKMKDTYGAHITDAQAQKITDYLVSINGKAGTGQAPKGTYGE